MAIDTELISSSRPGTNRVRRVLVIDERGKVADAVAQRLLSEKAVRPLPVPFAPSVAASGQGVSDAAPDVSDCEVVVFSPLRPRRGRLIADMDYAGRVISACRDAGVRQFVLISSAEIYGSDYSNPGMVPEADIGVRKRPNRLADTWVAIESLAREQLSDSGCRLSIVRPCYIVSGERREFAGRLFRARLAFPLAGYNPGFQVLSVADFASAVAAIVAAGKADTYHVAPREVIPLRTALRLAGAWSIPIPYSIQRAWRVVFAPLGLAESMEQVDFLRYPWTVSNGKLVEQLGVEPCSTSAQAIREVPAEPNGSTPPATAWKGRTGWCPVKTVPDTVPPFDDFGMDEQYIRSCARWQIGFMERWYWRVEADGLERIPEEGGAVMAGIHRGFMPFDGVMMVHLMLKHIGRAPRFLMHPGLVKFPHLSGFLRRFGGIIACQDNVDHILRQKGIVGVFPEGIRGAFRMYDRDVYKIGKQRNDYVKAALRYGVPIVPFVTVGPAESFPILGKIEWSWWKRFTHWPYFPITPTGNLVPLPSKWHMRILDPIPTDEYGPDAADDRKVVRTLSRRVHSEMQTAIDGMLSRRKSVFFGSIFKREITDTEPARNPPPQPEPSSVAAP